MKKKEESFSVPDLGTIGTESQEQLWREVVDKFAHGILTKMGLDEIAEMLKQKYFITKK